MIARVSRVFLFAGFLFLAAGSGRAAQSPEGLIERNPFYSKPPARKESPPSKPTVDESRNYEWVGYFKSSTGPRFAVRNTRSNKTYWVSAEEPKEGLQVMRHDLQGRKITLLTSGQQFDLALKDPSYAQGSPPRRGIPKSEDAEKQQKKAKPDGDEKKRDVPKIPRRVIIRRESA